MTSIFVSGNWFHNRKPLEKLLTLWDYSYYLPSYPKYGNRDQLGDFVETLAVMKTCDMLIAQPSDQFEIGYMCALHKPIMIYWEECLDSINYSEPPPGVRWHTYRPATFVVRDMDQVNEVLRDFKSISGELQAPNSQYAHVVAGLQAKFKIR